MCDKDGEFALHNSKLFKLKPFSMWSNNLAVFRNIAICILAIIVLSAAGYFQGGNIMVIATWTLIQRSWHHCILPSLTQNWIEVVTWSTQHVIKSKFIMSIVMAAVSLQYNILTSYIFHFKVDINAPNF